ncbi:MAG: hypothetical protein LC800_21495 [Acidobacteria bacterium]|nr:hypothetical protein [Acidobacteriota bacterium]
MFYNSALMELTVAVTGASGSLYAQRTLTHLAASGTVERVNLIMSEAALIVARVETGAKFSEGDVRAVSEWAGLAPDSKLVRWHRLGNMAAAPSSGSHPQAGMIVVPCSMGTQPALLPPPADDSGAGRSPRLPHPRPVRRPAHARDTVEGGAGGKERRTRNDER